MARDMNAQRHTNSLHSRLCPLDLSLALCVCVLQKNAVVSGTAVLLPLLSLPMLLLPPLAIITLQFAASKLKHRPIFPASSVASRFTSPLVLTLRAFVPMSTRPFGGI